MQIKMIDQYIDSYDFAFKVALVGDSGVGKKNIFNPYVFWRFIFKFT